MLQGSLDNFGLHEVLGLLADTSKSGRMRISGDRGSGSLWLSAGQLVQADATNVVDETPIDETMFELMRFVTGSFSFNVDEAPTKGHEPRPVSEVIAAARERLERWLEIEAVVPSLAHIIAPVASLPAPELTITAEEWELIMAIGGGCEVSAICDAFSLGEVEGSRRVKLLIERDLVEIFEPSVIEAAVSADEAAPLAARDDFDPTDYGVTTEPVEPMVHAAPTTPVETESFESAESFEAESFESAESFETASFEAESQEPRASFDAASFESGSFESASFESGLSYEHEPTADDRPVAEADEAATVAESGDEESYEYESEHAPASFEAPAGAFDATPVPAADSFGAEVFGAGPAPSGDDKPSFLDAQARTSESAWSPMAEAEVPDLAPDEHFQAAPGDWAPPMPAADASVGGRRSDDVPPPPPAPPAIADLYNAPTPPPPAPPSPADLVASERIDGAEARRLLAGREIADQPPMPSAEFATDELAGVIDGAEEDDGSLLMQYLRNES